MQCKGGRDYSNTEQVNKNSLLGGILFMSSGVVCGAIFRKYRGVVYEPREYGSIKMFAVRTLAAVIVCIPLAAICGLVFLIGGNYLVIMYFAITLPVYLGSFVIASGYVEKVEDWLLCQKKVEED